MTLSYAITAHKCQGDTLDEIVIDFEKDPGENRGVTYGSFYVALTRVKEGRNVFLKSFSEAYITFNKRVEETISSMKLFKAYSFKKIYVSEEIFKNKENEFKVGYFNIQGFMPSNHAKYLDCDLNLLNLDFLMVKEIILDNTR